MLPTTRSPPANSRILPPNAFSCSAVACAAWCCADFGAGGSSSSSTSRPRDATRRACCASSCRSSDASWTARTAKGPAGAVDSTEWYDDPPWPAYRIIHGRVRSVGGPIHHTNDHTTGLAEVETNACQRLDGTLEVDDPPQIQVQAYSDNGITPEQARAVAAALLEAADEVDGWVQR